MGGAGLIMLLVIMGAAVVPCAYLCICQFTIIVAIAQRILLGKLFNRETEKEKTEREQAQVVKENKRKKKQKAKQIQKAQFKNVKIVKDGQSKEMDDLESGEYIYDDEEEEEEEHEEEYHQGSESEEGETSGDFENGQQREIELQNRKR